MNATNAGAEPAHVTTAGNDQEQTSAHSNYRADLIERRKRDLPPGVTVDEDEIARSVDRELLEALSDKPTVGGIRQRDGAVLLDDIAEMIGRFVACSQSARDAAALFVVHTHAFAAADCSPRFVLSSAEPQSGKTRFLEILKLLVHRPLFTANISEAALFRKIDADGVTILFDEIDAIFGPKARGDREDLRALLNAGYERGAVVTRCSGEGAKMVVKDFQVFAPVALAGIGRLPETIEQRAIVVRLKRRAPDENVERLRRREIAPETDALRSQVGEWASTHMGTLSSARPELPEELSDRAADVWEPLLAIADAAGGSWVARARVAAVELFTAREADESTVGIRLLGDIHDVFGVDLGLASGTLADRLGGIEGSPWPEWKNGKPITANALARLLKKYGVKPDQHRIGDDAFRGYLRSDFADAWSRYLTLPPESATSDTSATPQSQQGQRVLHSRQMLHISGDVEDDLGAWCSDDIADLIDTEAVA